MTDIFIRNIDWLITVDAERRIFTDGALALEEGEIYREVAERVPDILSKTGLKEKVRPKWPVI